MGGLRISFAPAADIVVTRAVPLRFAPTADLPMPRFPHFCIFALALGAACTGRGAEPQRVLKLTLDTALQGALARNFSIEIQRIEPKIAKEAVRQELGRFDPVWDVSAIREETRRRDVFADSVRLQTRNRSRLDNLSSGISGVSAWGTEYDLGYGTRGNTGTATLLGDSYETRGSLSLTQPLLRDAGPVANLDKVRIARSALKVSEWQLRQRIIEVIDQTVFVYSDLQAAVENLHVDLRSRELARQLLKDNQARVEIGVKSPLDVIEARAVVAAREEAVLLSQRSVLVNENLLKQIVTTDMMTLLGTRVEIEPPPTVKFAPDVPRGVADALALRPDYRQGLLELEQQHIRVAFRKNQLLPRIDLTGSIGLLGLDNDFGSSLSRVGGRDRTEWTAGVIFSIPLGNRAARGAYSQAQLEAAKRIMMLNELEQQIIVDVDNASGQIVTSELRIASNMEARQLAKASLDAGEERLRAGTGTTFEVLELQEKLAQAEGAEVRARADYNKALSFYYRQTGAALRVHRVEIE